MSLTRLVLSLTLAAGSLLALPGCDGSDSTTGPTFVTELATQDAAGNDKQSFRIGETVHLKMTVRNRTQQTIEVELPGWCGEFEFMVAQARSSNPLWRQSHQLFCIQAVLHTTFAPLETKTFRGTWNQVDDLTQQVPAGDYEVFGTMADNTFPGQARSQRSELSSTLKLITIN